MNGDQPGTQGSSGKTSSSSTGSDSPDRASHTFFLVAGISTAIGLGAVSAALASIAREGTGLVLRCSWRTPVGLVLGACGGFLYWRLIERVSGNSARFGRNVRFASVGLLFVGLAAFLYPLRFLPGDQLPDIIFGLVCAGIVLGLGAAFLWRLKRFFE